MLAIITRLVEPEPREAPGAARGTSRPGVGFESCAPCYAKWPLKKFKFIAITRGRTGQANKLSRENYETGPFAEKGRFQELPGRPASVSQAPCQTRAQLRDVSVSALAQPLRSFRSGFSALPRKYMGHRLTCGVIFRCHALPPFRCIHGALEARALKWRAFPPPGDLVLPGSDWQGRALHPRPSRDDMLGAPVVPWRAL